mgnify:CR=1
MKSYKILDPKGIYMGRVNAVKMHKEGYADGAIRFYNFDGNMIVSLWGVTVEEITDGY